MFIPPVIYGSVGVLTSPGPPATANAGKPETKHPHAVAEFVPDTW